MNIPKNKTIVNQYSNGENIFLRYPKSKIPYIGYYNIVNGVKYFTGKEYTSNSKSLEKYNLKELTSSVKSLIVKKNNNTNDIRYFYKDIYSSQIMIKEIDVKEYNKFKGNPSSSYQVVSYDPKVQTVEEVNKLMGGLKEFLET